MTVQTIVPLYTLQDDGSFSRPLDAPEPDPTDEDREWWRDESDRLELARLDREFDAMARESAMLDAVCWESGTYTDADHILCHGC
jgi:hypothetical protein